MGKVAVYIRTSTRDQDGEAQKHALERYLAQRGETDAEWYPDLHHSGIKAKRPELDRLCHDVRNGNVSRIYIYGLDRLGRSLRNLLDLFEFFTKHNVPVISMREGIDCTTAIGRLFLQLMGSLAEFEREMIRERSLAGIAVARSKNIKLGPKYTDARLEHRAQVLKAHGEGLSYGKIAKSLGLARSMVVRIVHDARKST